MQVNWKNSRIRLEPNLPYTQKITSCCQQIWFLALFVRYEHDLCSGVWVLKGKLGICFKFTSLIIELHNFHFIAVVFNKGTNCKAHVFIFADTPVHTIDEPRCFIGVDLRSPLWLLPKHISALIMCHLVFFFRETKIAW